MDDIEMPKRIYRHGAPGKLDICPEGTECFVEVNNKIEIYIQIGTDELDPVWELVNTVPLDDERLI